MSQEITIKFDFLSLIEKLDALAQQEIPFATSLALNRTAKLAQEKTREELDSIFVTRTNWLAKGIQIKASSKRDWPKSWVEIGSRDQFMLAQEEGGEKKAMGSKLVAQPIAARVNPKALTKPATWPGALLKKKKFFLNTIATGPRKGMQAVMRRETDDRYPLQVLYLLKPKVKIEARWNLRATVQKTFDDHFDTEFGRALSRALATAKSR